MRRVLSAALAIGAVLLIPIASTLPVGAIESFGIGAIPANPRADNPRTKSIFVYTAEPNKTIQDEVKIINNSDSVKTISVYPVDSQASSDGAFACAQAVDERKAVGGWIKLASSEVTLQPNTSEKVPFTLTVPANTEVGEHNGCIALQDVSPSAATKTENGIVLSFRSAIRVAITVPGEIVTKLSLVEVKSQQHTKKLQISPVLKNTGNVSLDSKLDVKLTNIFGGTASSANGQFPVLTGTTSRFNFEVDRPFWGGWYAQEVSASYLPLTDAGNTDKQTNLTTEKKWVFIPPQPAAAAVEIGFPLVLIAAGVYLTSRRRNLATLKARTVEYKVRASDNIQSVALAHHIEWKQLAKINHLKAPYSLATGDIIAVPRQEPKQKKTTGRK